MPEIIHLERRRDDVIAAINRYNDENMTVQEEWLLELNFLNNRISLLE
jgi:hypothetical protein